MRMTTAIAGLLLTLPGMAQAAEPVCLTPAEFSSLAAYALPSAINGTAKRCAPSLGSSSYLGKSGTALANRYAERKAASWPGAKAAFLKMSGTGDASTNKLIANLPDDSLRQMFDPLLEGLVAQEIPLEKCGTIDTFMRLLAPLPPENTAELIALTVGLASKTKGKKKIGDFALCDS